MGSIFAFYILLNACADRIAELQNKLLLAPEVTVTSKNLEAINFSDLFSEVSNQDNNLKIVWKKMPSQYAIKKNSHFNPAAAKELYTLIEYLSRSGKKLKSIGFENGESEHSRRGKLRFHIQPITFEINTLPRKFIITAEDGALEINQAPHLIKKLPHQWKQTATDLFNMNFVGTEGWATGGGGTHINIGSRFDQISIFNQYPLLLFRLYKLIFYHPGILFHLDEATEHSDASNPLWTEEVPDSLKSKIVKISNLLRSTPKAKILNTTVLQLKSIFSADNHEHFLSLKVFYANLNSEKKIQPYAEVRCLRSVQSYEELEALEYFWFYTVAYLIDHEPEESEISFKAPDETPIPLLTEDFKNWMNKINLPQAYQNILMSLGNAEVGSPANYIGPKVSYNFFRIPSRLGKTNSIGIQSINNKNLIINGLRKGPYARLPYNPIAPISYIIETEGLSELTTVTIRQKPFQWPEISTHKPQIESFFSKNILDLKALRIAPLRKRLSVLYPDEDFDKILDIAYLNSRIIIPQKNLSEYLRAFLQERKTPKSIVIEKRIEDSSAIFKISTPFSERTIKKIRAGIIKIKT